MNAHTPGKWEYGVRKDGSIWLSLGDYRTGPHYQGDLCATEADARLIASAPELLAALIVAKVAIEWWQDNHGCCAGATDDKLRAIESAITKATGATE